MHHKILKSCIYIHDYAVIDGLIWIYNIYIHNKVHIFNLLILGNDYNDAGTTGIIERN